MNWIDKLIHESKDAKDGFFKLADHYKYRVDSIEEIQLIRKLIAAKLLIVCCGIGFIIAVAIHWKEVIEFLKPLL